MSVEFLTAVQNRRTVYGISKESTISNERIQEIIEHAVMHTPSSFNSQSARVVLLLGEHHDKLWDITKESLRRIVPEDQFEASEQRIQSFKNGYGTVLFFEDSGVIEYLQKEFATYKDNFPIWSQQSSGMHQFVVWTGFHVEGLGASLQHYNELIEEDVRSQWNIPQNWKLIAQMPFGKTIAEPGEKQYSPMDIRFKVFS
jgi:uncharacterized protein